MSTLLKRLSTIAFALSTSLSTLACVDDEFDEFEDDQFRPQSAPCPLCKIKKPTNELYLTLDPTYDSYTLLEMTVTITDANGATEVLHYPATALPPLSSTTEQVITEPELASVGTTGLTPILADVNMKFGLSGTTMWAGNAIPLY
jgi:hypothetical protein